MLNQVIYFLKRPYHFVKTGLLQGFPAELQYGFPAKKLHIISITGTDGKTTSSTLLYYVLKQAGKKVALLSTVAAYIGNEEIDTGFHVTTPDPASLQKFMSRMVKEGYEYLVLESTSHGIYQYRLWGVQPEIVGVTNITLEHLDYHLTHDLYVRAKLLLAKKAKHIVFNHDDEMSAAKIRRELKHTAVDKITYSSQDQLSKKVVQAINTRFPQLYNRMNARLVYAIAQLLNVSDQDYCQAIEQFPGVIGRMEKVAEYHQAEVIVDFAHTPNALTEALETLRARMKREKRTGKLIAIFGCAGLRDRQKRPLMGRAGAELADLAIFTAEDPRTEDIWSIIRQMKSDLGPYHAKVLSIADRREAIEFAVQNLLEPGDILGIFGKGHEKSMCYGTVEYPWSDAQAVKEAISKRNTQ